MPSNSDDVRPSAWIAYMIPDKATDANSPKPTAESLIGRTIQGPVPRDLEPDTTTTTTSTATLTTTSILTATETPYDKRDEPGEKKGEGGGNSQGSNQPGSGSRGTSGGSGYTGGGGTNGGVYTPMGGGTTFIPDPHQNSAMSNSSGFPGLAWLLFGAVFWILVFKRSRG
ncbi:hypothetical protein BT63DRAFT_288420 [Microthyrium microscopicum]|uniref:Uncharacterized protein n=1 Tax=Microthyrium microscopicum TaxID=703497 RepID=A0A6A6U536_9PEZI|nr:hypothetical protein BT63DRAFT_288420 [Microthyrium microscopicum]